MEAFNKHREKGIESLNKTSPEALYPNLFYTLQGLYSLKKTGRMTQEEWLIIINAIHRLEALLDIKR